MIFDVGIVLACHVITSHLALFIREPKTESRLYRWASIFTIAVGCVVFVDLMAKAFLGIK